MPCAMDRFSPSILAETALRVDRVEVTGYTGVLAAASGPSRHRAVGCGGKK